MNNDGKDTLIISVQLIKPIAVCTQGNLYHGGNNNSSQVFVIILVLQLRSSSMFEIEPVFHSLKQIFQSHCAFFSLSLSHSLLLTLALTHIHIGMSTLSLSYCYNIISKGGSIYFLDAYVFV